ncbi:hypothetical protein ACS0TY_028283 [Phlomoides rotata]
MLALIYKEIKEKDVKVDEYMKAMSSQFKNLETQVNQQQKNMEFQIGQLATTVGHMQNKGKFPSTTEPNPREHCKAVELRSGKRYESPTMPIDLEEEEVDQGDETKKQDEVLDEEIEENKDEEGVKKEKEKEKEEVQDEVTKKKVEKGESSKKVPKWKVAKELRDKKGLDVECDEWGIPKTLVPPPYPKSNALNIDNEFLVNTCTYTNDVEHVDV